MPLASLELPSRAFPSRGAVPALAGRLLPCGFRSPTAAGVVPAGASRPLSRIAPVIRRSRPPEGRPGTHGPGRSFLVTASPVASPRTRRDARAVLSLPTPGSPVYGRHAHFEALLPPGVRSATAPIPGQAEAARRCSPGVLSLQSFLHYGSGSGHSRRHTQGTQGSMPRASPGAQPSRLHSATWTPTPGLASPGSADTQGLENPTHHRQAATQLTEGLASPPVRQPPAPSSLPAGRVRTERLARAPSRRHPAPPCPSRPSPPEGAPVAGPRRRWLFEPYTSPTPCEASWRPGPSRNPIWSPVAG
jgi:hypothetical protein